jgi:hypothetical protein
LRLIDFVKETHTFSDDVFLDAHERLVHVIRALHAKYPTIGSRRRRRLLRQRRRMIGG